MLKRIKKSNNNIYHLSSDYLKPIFIENNEYNQSDLNWRDDGGTIDEYSLTDPSKKDYAKGYQMEPYTFRPMAFRNVLHQLKQGEKVADVAKKYFGHKSFASKIIEMNSNLDLSQEKEGLMLIVGREPNINEKEAAKEVIDISYTPENLAKEILTLWSQADGPLQNFYEGFTVNKATNKMKQDIADILKQWGYEVTPVLVDETPRYAKKMAAFEILSKVKNKTSILDALNYFNSLFPDSKVLQKVAEDVKSLEDDQNIKADKHTAQGLIEYYKMIFPDDYAASLVTNLIEKPNMEFAEFRDISISDEALNQMEKMDSGNQKPLGGPNDGGVGGYDFTTHMRPDGPGGVMPNNYEVRANKVRDRIKKN